MDAIQATALNVKIRHLGSWSAQRRANAGRYHQLFSQAGLTDTLGLPVTLPGRDHVWNQYTIRVPDGHRDGLRQFLMQRKIGTEIYYPVALHQQECFCEMGSGEADLPETERATREVLHLPIFPELTAEQQQSVVGQIAEFFASEIQTKTHVIKPPSFIGDARQRRSA
jgi:dTDP-4-amino-4,6-dideoxygalactose transaminase